MFTLTVQSGDAERELVFDRDAVRIGRHEDNEVVLTDDAVSRYHARIESRDGAFVLRDLDSRNGVYVNNIPVSDRELENEDHILVGNTRIVFRRRSPRSGQELSPPTDKPTVPAKAATSGTASSRRDTTSSKDLERRLDIITNLNKIVLQAGEPKQLLERILTFIEKNFIFDRAAILLENPATAQLEVAASRSREGGSEEIAISRSALEAARQPGGLLARNAQRDPRFASSQSVRLHGIRSMLATPLAGENAVLGVVYLDISIGRHIYGQDDLQFLLALGREVGLALENFRLREESRQAEQMAIVGRTMASVSQSVKNVLLLTKSSSALMASALNEENLPRIRRAWEVLQHNQEKIYRVIEDMLFYSQGRARLFEQGDVNNTIRDTVESVIERLQADGISLQLELDPRVEPIWTDLAALTRSFQNLLYNAWEAVQGQESARIGVRTRLQPDERFSIAVSDNGPAIPAEKIPLVFEPFQNPRGIGAGGLSLALARRLISDLEGSLAVHSGEKGGAEFTISLPCHRMKPEELTIDPAFMKGPRIGGVKP